LRRALENESPPSAAVFPQCVNSRSFLVYCSHYKSQCRSYVCDLILGLPFSCEVYCRRNLPTERGTEFLLEPTYLSHSFYRWSICSRDTVLSRIDVARGFYDWKNTALNNF
jgi:hypothetical protein